MWARHHGCTASPHRQRGGRKALRSRAGSAARPRGRTGSTYAIVPGHRKSVRYGGRDGRNGLPTHARCHRWRQNGESHSQERRPWLAIPARTGRQDRQRQPDRNVGHRAWLKATATAGVVLAGSCSSSSPASTWFGKSQAVVTAEPGGSGFVVCIEQPCSPPPGQNEVDFIHDKKAGRIP